MRQAVAGRVAASAGLLCLLWVVLPTGGARADDLELGWQRVERPAGVELLGVGRANVRRQSAGAVSQPVRLVEEPEPEALGDRLVISKDDGIGQLPLGYEGRLSVSDGVAGSADHLAFRFEAGELARQLPVTISGLRVGFDNAYGRTSWPLIGIAREDTSAGLVLGPILDTLSGIDLPEVELALPAMPGVPDDFMRFDLQLPNGVEVQAELVVDDGMWSDAFERPIDELLDNAGSDWLECDAVSLACQLVDGQKLLEVSGNRVIKRQAPGRSDYSVLAAKFPASDVLARRPVTDLNLAVSVSYDATAATADRIGLALRVESLLEHYLLEYQRSTGELRLSAQTPGGLVPIAVSAGPHPPSGRLSAVVSGSSPVRIDVALDGAPVAPLTGVEDATWRYAGVLSGLASLGDSEGEAWDDFEVRRNPDLFAVVQLPPGEDAALPAELSPSAGGFANVLASSDGSNYELLQPGTNCTRAPNGYVGLAVEDTSDDGVDNLFDVESKPVTLRLECPGCPQTRNLCADNLSQLDYSLPVIEVGASVDLTVGWWNEHVADVGALLWRAQVFEGDCVGAPLASLDTTPALDPGQLSSGGPVYAELPIPLGWTPASDGPHCVQVFELYDLNGDGCPDGAEPPASCGVSCDCVADPDQNLATGVLRQRFDVELPCSPLAASALAANSLRLAKLPGEPLQTALSWQNSAGVPGSYNLHLTDERELLAEPIMRMVVPPWTRVEANLGQVTTQRELPSAEPAVFLKVYQNDGCPSGWSLADP